MKKFLAFTVALALTLSLTACSGNTDNNTNSDTIDSTSYRVGIGSYTTAGDSSSSVEGENGKGVVSTTYATVIFDENNIIRKVYIDEVQSKIYFDGNGQLANPNGFNDIRSKRELGDEYNMKPASGIGKEWYEQINSLESWLVGKNIDEISKGVLNMGSYGTNGDYANNIVNGAENDAGGMMDGAKNIVDGVVDGAENMMDGGNGNNSRNSTNSTNNTNNSTNAGGTDAQNTTGDTQTDSTPPANNGIAEGDAVNDDNGNATGNGMNGTNTDGMDNASSSALDWEGDLKSSVTIDLTNIKIALHKAYMNAR